MSDQPLLLLCVTLGVAAWGDAFGLEVLGETTHARKTQQIEMPPVIEEEGNVFSCSCWWVPRLSLSGNTVHNQRNKKMLIGAQFWSVRLVKSTKEYLDWVMSGGRRNSYHMTWYLRNVRHMGNDEGEIVSFMTLN